MKAIAEIIEIAASLLILAFGAVFVIVMFVVLISLIETVIEGF